MYRQPTPGRFGLRFSIASAALISLTSVFPGVARADRHEDHSTSIRVATFNVSLFGNSPGAMAERLSDQTDEQIEKLVSIVQAIRPDVLLVNELDTDQWVSNADRSGSPTNADRLADHFAVPGKDLAGIDYRYRYSAASNTGVPSGIDLNGNGTDDDLNDAWGFGRFPGQYGIAILSRYPIAVESIRTFQTYRWCDLPGALRPKMPDGSDYYTDQAWKSLRLSSKNHVDLPIQISGRTLHLLASHPTPPVFDGPEDHNGCRNHDEIAFWSRYIENSSAIIDDSGVVGGLDDQTSFVVVGDLNSDPVNGDSRHESILELLNHPRTTNVAPMHDGQTTTAAFGKKQMRVDYAIPSKDLTVENTGVYWPTDKPGADWVTASDHRLVWIDVKFTPQ